MGIELDERLKLLVGRKYGSNGKNRTSLRCYKVQIQDWLVTNGENKVKISNSGNKGRCGIIHHS